MSNSSDNNINGEPVNILNRSTEPRPNNNNNKPKTPKEDITFHHMYQLTRIQKALVKVLFREAYIKGFRMDQIPEFIYIKSKLNVTYGLVETLKKMQAEDDRYWFFELARDSTAYLSCYRLAIDKLSQLEREMWLIIMNPKIEPSVRVMATKEIHAITKTSVLLLRELPFITNLSKFYDLSSLDPNKEGIRKLQYAKDKNNHDAYDPLNHELTKDVFDGANSSLVHNILDNLKDKKRIDSVDADVMDTMNGQMASLGYSDDPESQAEQEKQRKSFEDRYIEKNLDKMDRELSQVTSEDESKVIKAAQDYRKTMDYLDHIITPEHRESIRRIKDITEKDKEEED